MSTAGKILPEFNERQPQFNKAEAIALVVCLIIKLTPMSNPNTLKVMAIAFSFLLVITHPVIASRTK
ncbi:hypothetical protein NIES22_25850 [Calothrix brevissima NIES-22]|nr:hypothetical protein NIES22_25850 [Calothrix brevissima NIES-22]